MNKVGRITQVIEIITLTSRKASDQKSVAYDDDRCNLSHAWAAIPSEGPAFFIPSDKSHPIPEIARLHS
jgi:hypothetical protein